VWRCGEVDYGAFVGVGKYITATKLPPEVYLLYSGEWFRCIIIISECGVVMLAGRDQASVSDYGLLRYDHLPRYQFSVNALRCPSRFCECPSQFNDIHCDSINEHQGLFIIL